jgi:hypothetical protein
MDRSGARTLPAGRSAVRAFSYKLDEDAVGDPGIIQRPVGGRQQDPEHLPQGSQVVAAGGGDQDGGQVVGVDELVQGQDALALQEGQVEADVVPQDGSIAGELDQLAQAPRKLGARKTISLLIPVSWVTKGGSVCVG